MGIRWIFYMLMQLCFASLLWTQELVPNGSFEDLTGCPSWSNYDVSLATPWFNPSSTGTPNLFNACANGTGFGVPLIHGEFDGNTPANSYQLARTGVGMAHIVTYLNVGGPSHVQNLVQDTSAAHRGNGYISAPLLDTLKVGRQYYLSFYVCADHGFDSRYWDYSDAVGMAFSEGAHYEEVQYGKGMALPVAIERTEGDAITDTVNWTRIDGCYTANGRETHITIGNFRDNEEVTEISNFPTILPKLIFLFVDDVSVIPFNPLPDTVLRCTGGQASLDATFMQGSYRWSTGETTPAITVYKAGNYTVEVSMGSCILRDTVLVIDAWEEDVRRIDTILCQGDVYVARPGLPGEYQWDIGGQAAQHFITEGGIYGVNIENDCGLFRVEYSVDFIDCDCRLYVPNAFSPNFDGINDGLTPFLYCGHSVSQMSFSIFDRWGAHVFFTSGTDGLLPWDGNYQGKPANQGDYTWVLEYELIIGQTVERKVATGSVTLLR